MFRLCAISYCGQRRKSFRSRRTEIWGFEENALGLIYSP